MAPQKYHQRSSHRSHSEEVQDSGIEDTIAYWIDFVLCTAIFGLGIRNHLLGKDELGIQLRIPIVILVFMLKFTVSPPRIPPPEHFTHGAASFINKCFEYVQKLLRKFSKQTLIDAVVGGLRYRLGLQQLSENPLTIKILKKVKYIMKVFDRAWLFPYIHYLDLMNVYRIGWEPQAGLALFASFAELICPENEPGVLGVCKYVNNRYIRMPTIASKLLALLSLIFVNGFENVKLAVICPKETTLLYLIYHDRTPPPPPPPKPKEDPEDCKVQ